MMCRKELVIAPRRAAAKALPPHEATALPSKVACLQAGHPDMTCQRTSHIVEYNCSVPIYGIEHSVIPVSKSTRYSSCLAFWEHVP